MYGHFYSLICPLLVFRFFSLVRYIINKRVRVCVFCTAVGRRDGPAATSFTFSRTPNATHRIRKGGCEREISPTKLMTAITENTPSRRGIGIPVPLAEPESFDWSTFCFLDRRLSVSVWLSTHHTQAPPLLGMGFLFILFCTLSFLVLR